MKPWAKRMSNEQADYEALIREWQDNWASLTRSIDPDFVRGKWNEPEPPSRFANGKLHADGNPILLVRSDILQCEIRIILLGHCEPSDLDTEFYVGSEKCPKKSGSCFRRLVISLIPEKHTEQMAFSIIRQWLVHVGQQS